jgi:vacuolar-type H+-ATPase subunit I/STV1
LKLAWIEFNSKFFAAEGTLFDPLALEVGNNLLVSADIVRNE